MNVCRETEVVITSFCDIGELGVLEKVPANTIRTFHTPDNRNKSV